jgi:hypothetical protein
MNSIGTSTAFIEKVRAPSRASTINPRFSARATSPIDAHALFHAAKINVATQTTRKTNTTIRFKR